MAGEYFVKSLWLGCAFLQSFQKLMRSGRCLTQDLLLRWFCDFKKSHNELLALPIILLGYFSLNAQSSGSIQYTFLQRHTPTCRHIKNKWEPQCVTVSGILLYLRGTKNFQGSRWLQFFEHPVSYIAFLWCFTSFLHLEDLLPTFSLYLRLLVKLFKILTRCSCL